MSAAIRRFARVASASAAHITARVLGSDHHFLSNPHGMLFEEVTAYSLVKVDLAGRH